MKSNYKRIGDFIRLVDERNEGLRVQQLLGLSISKKFIPSVANVIGTDMENYKIIRRNQFACSIMQVRRDGKMPVALLQNVDEAIISQAYPVFEIKDERKLLPEYLMMWFSRSEFDREACFYAIGGVRGSLEWEDFENMRLPVPSIEKQREIVAEYNTVQKRIQLNEQLIQKLEATAQAIYKQWFVDGVEEIVERVTVKDFCRGMKSGGTPSRLENNYWNKKEIPWIKTGEIKNNIITCAEEFISEDGLNNSSAKILPTDTVLMSMYGVNAGELAILKFPSATNQACCGMICHNQTESAFLYYHLLHNQEFIASQAVGGAQENLSKDFIEKIEIPQIKNSKLDLSIFKIIIDNKEVYTRQIEILNTLKTIILSELSIDKSIADVKI